MPTQQQTHELTLEELDEILGPTSEVDWRAHIDVDPAVVGGKPRIKETRISVDLLLDFLAGGSTEASLLESYPHLSKEQIRAAWAFAAETLRIDRGAATGLVRARRE